MFFVLQTKGGCKGGDVDILLQGLCTASDNRVNNEYRWRMRAGRGEGGGMVVVGGGDVYRLRIENATSKTRIKLFLVSHLNRGGFS